MEPAKKPEGDTTPQWLEWLKKPENMMTGLVLLAGLAQPRRQNQNTAGVIGERALGALAFRGGLQKGVQDQQMREREFQQQSSVQNAQVAQGGERNQIAREQIATDVSQGQANRDLQQKLATTVKPLTPEESRLTTAQAGYYDRMPRDPSGANGANANRDRIEEMIAGKFIESKMMTDPNYVVNPIEVAQHLQPYRNARVQVDAMKAQGLMGEIVTDASGQYKVRVVGVSDPSNLPSIEPQGTQATLEPTTASQPVMGTQPATVVPVDEIVKLRPNIGGGGRGNVAGSTAKSKTAAQARQLDYIRSLDRETLEDLLRRAKGRGNPLSNEELKAVKEALKAKATNANSE